MRPATSRATSSSSPSGTTRDTRPMRSASSASIVRPVSRMSLACAAPMSRGSSQLAPSSVLVRPLTMPVLLKVADSAAKRSSAASDRHMPPP